MLHNPIKGGLAMQQLTYGKKNNYQSHMNFNAFHFVLNETGLHHDLSYDKM